MAEEIKETETEEQNLKYKLSMTMLRDKRNILLRETDYWAYEDTPTMTDAQKKYRQELRDITKKYDHINKVVWPEKPTG